MTARGQTLPSRVARGRLITIEGLDGAGKSTLAEALAQGDRRPRLRVELLREPGGVPVSERIRELVKDPRSTVTPRTEALLYAAARAQLVHERLDRCCDGGASCCSTGSWTPRWPTRAPAAGWGSRWSARSTASPPAPSRPTARCCCASPRPPAARARTRAPLRRTGWSARASGFFEQIAAAYDELARAEPERIRMIDAAQPPSAGARTSARRAIEDLLEHACARD